MSNKNAIFENLIPNEMGCYDIKPEELKKLFSDCHVVDVRRPDEWVSELGHISGVQFATLETNFVKFIDAIPSAQKNDTWVFVCRSGARSAKAAAIAIQKGIPMAHNMMGGMIQWNNLGFPVALKVGD